MTDIFGIHSQDQPVPVAMEMCQEM